MVGKDEGVEGRLPVPAPNHSPSGYRIINLKATMFNKTNGVKFNLSVLFSNSNAKMIGKYQYKASCQNVAKSVYQKSSLHLKILAKDGELLSAVKR